MSLFIDTNKILKQQGGKSKPVYFIPGYLRLKVKNFTEMDLQNLNGAMNATIIFSIYYGSLPQSIVKQLLNNIILLFGRDDALQLTDEEDLQIKVSRKQKQRQIQFTIRKIFKLRIQSDVFWTPFQIINLIFSITVQSVDTQQGTIKINLMDNQNDILKLSYSEEGTFGNYDLAQTRMRTIYSNDRTCKTQTFYLKQQQKQQQYQAKYIDKLKPQPKIQHFQYAHFLVPLYKYPSVSLATIFFPLWICAIVNLGIFFQDNNLADRIGSIGGIIVAFVALVPTIRDQIPPSPTIVFIQVLVYMQSITSILVLIDSISIRNTDGYAIIWQQNGLFLASAIIFVITIIPIFVLVVIHYAKWQPSYNSKGDQKELKFDRKTWQHKLCDKYYTKIMELSKKRKIDYLEDNSEGKYDSNLVKIEKQQN